MKLLFLCTGNASRSPFAEQYFTMLLRRHGVSGITCESAGMGEPARQGSASPQMITAAKAWGIDLQGHRRRHYTTVPREEIRFWIVMESAQAERLQADGIPAKQILLLGGGIADPYRQSDAVHAECCQTLAAALDELFRSMEDTLRDPKKTIEMRHET